MHVCESAFVWAHQVQIFAQADPLSKPVVSIHAEDTAAAGIEVDMQSLLTFQALPNATQPVDVFTLSCPVIANASMSIKGVEIWLTTLDFSMNSNVIVVVVGCRPSCVGRSDVGELYTH